MPYTEPLEDEKLRMLEESIRQTIPVIFCYYSKDGNISARAVLIEKVAYNQRGQLYFTGLDSLSGESRSFIVQNTLSFHVFHFRDRVINTDVDWNDNAPDDWTNEAIGLPEPFALNIPE